MNLIRLTFSGFISIVRSGPDLMYAPDVAVAVGDFYQVDQVDQFGNYNLSGICANILEGNIKLNESGKER